LAILQKSKDIFLLLLRILSNTIIFILVNFPSYVTFPLLIFIFALIYNTSWGKICIDFLIQVLKIVWKHSPNLGIEDRIYFLTEQFNKLLKIYGIDYLSTLVSNGLHQFLKSTEGQKIISEGVKPIYDALNVNQQLLSNQIANVQQNIQQIVPAITDVMNNPAILAPLALQLENGLLKVNNNLLKSIKKSNNNFEETLDTIRNSCNNNELYTQNQEIKENIMLMSDQLQHNQKITTQEFEKIKNLIQRTDFGKLLNSLGLNTDESTDVALGFLSQISKPLLQFVKKNNYPIDNRVEELFGGKKKSRKSRKSKKSRKFRKTIKI
jgi:Ca2+-binding EF-hand superfamily protein